MNAYHALASPLQKQAGLPVAAIGRSLMRRGLWGSVARGGEMLAGRGGRTAAAGNALATGARGMRTASPYLMGYGLAGMAAAPMGYDLPGSSLALNIGTPGWGALFSAPSLIRTGRLATGDYDTSIERDAMDGARFAGSQWIEATKQHAPSAYDPGEYVRLLQSNGIDTSAAERYLGPGRIQPQGMWRRVGNVFENPTGNVVPEVQKRIYETMFKGASYTELEKSAFLPAVAKAYRGFRSAGAGRLHSGLRSLRVGSGLTRPQAQTIGKWGGRAFGTGMFGLAALDGYDAITSDKPYDELAIQQEGYDGAQAAIRDRLSKMTPFERRMAQLDPSLAVNALEQRLPGSIATWEDAKGEAYQPGLMGGVQQFWNAYKPVVTGGIRQAWESRGTPTYYSTDAAGNAVYL
jgi:hypothetical protein